MSSNRLLLVTGFVAILATGCGGDDTGNGGGAATQIEVTARDFEFVTTSLDAEAGAEVEVTLVNEGEAAHTFTIEDVVEVEAEGGEEASTTFTAPDTTVEFFCAFHPDQMRGQLTIGGSAEDDTGGGGAGDPGDDLDY